MFGNAKPFHAEFGQRAPGKPVRERCEQTPKSVDGVDIPEDPGAERGAVLGVVVCQEFVLELGHVHIRWTLRLAGLALEAKIQHIVNDRVCKSPIELT